MTERLAAAPAERLAAAQADAWRERSKTRTRTRGGAYFVTNLKGGNLTDPDLLERNTLDIGTNEHKKKMEKYEFQESRYGYAYYDDSLKTFLIINDLETTLVIFIIHGCKKSL